MRAISGFDGVRQMDRHQKMSAILGGLCIFAMAIGVTPGLTVGQTFGAIIAVLAFGSILTLAVRSSVERVSSPVVGRIESGGATGLVGVGAEKERSGRRAA